MTIHKLSLLTLALISLMVCTACSKLDQEADTDIGLNLPDQESWNSTIILSHKGSKRATIQAGHLMKYESRGDVFIGDSMRVDFFNMEGEHVSTMSSDSGIVNEIHEHVRAIGNVVLMSDSGYVMLTERLFWRNDSNRVYTDMPIDLYSATDTLYGTGFESDVHLENWTITQPTGHSYREIAR